MPKFKDKKTSNEVEAVLYNGTERAVIQVMYLLNNHVKAIRQDGISLIVPCGNVKRRAEKGDWIVKNDTGELSIFKQDAFEEKYVKV